MSEDPWRVIGKAEQPSAENADVPAEKSTEEKAVETAAKEAPALKDRIQGNGFKTLIDGQQVEFE